MAGAALSQGQVQISRAVAACSPGQVNPPTPVERVDGSPQLGLPSQFLIKAEGFWDCLFLGTPPLDAQDLHPQHHQDYLVAMNLSVFCRY